MEYVVLYTHQKTKKAKTWQDGVLSVSTQTNKAVLYDDKKCNLDAMFIKPEAVVVGEQLESDRFFILIEAKQSDKPEVPIQPVKLAPVRVPIRTGLKRKKTGFIPPRVVGQPVINDSQEIMGNSSGESYLDLLRKKRTLVRSPQRDVPQIFSSEQQIITKSSLTDVQQLYTSHTKGTIGQQDVRSPQRDDPHMSDSPALGSSLGQQGLSDKPISATSGSCKADQGPQSNKVAYSSDGPSSTSNLTNYELRHTNNVSSSPQIVLPGDKQQSSPWSSYSNRLRLLNNIKSKKTSPLISQVYNSQENVKANYESSMSQNSSVKHENLEADSELFMDKNSEDASCGMSENVDSNSTSMNSRRSMSQILTLLANNKSHTINETKASTSHSKPSNVPDNGENSSHSRINTNDEFMKIKSNKNQNLNMGNVSPRDNLSSSHDNITGSDTPDLLTCGGDDMDENIAVRFNINYSPLSHISDAESVTMETEDAQSQNLGTNGQACFSSDLSNKTIKALEDSFFNDQDQLHSSQSSTLETLTIKTTKGSVSSPKTITDTGKCNDLSVVEPEKLHSDNNLHVIQKNDQKSDNNLHVIRKDALDNNIHVHVIPKSDQNTLTVQQTTDECPVSPRNLLNRNNSSNYKSDGFNDWQYTKTINGLTEIQNLNTPINQEGSSASSRSDKLKDDSHETTEMKARQHLYHSLSDLKFSPDSYHYNNESQFTQDSEEQNVIKTQYSEGGVNCHRAHLCQLSAEQNEELPAHISTKLATDDDNTPVTNYIDSQECIMGDNYRSLNIENNLKKTTNFKSNDSSQTEYVDCSSLDDSDMEYLVPENLSQEFTKGDNLIECNMGDNSSQSNLYDTEHDENTGHFYEENASPIQKYPSTDYPECYKPHANQPCDRPYISSTQGLQHPDQLFSRKGKTQLNTKSHDPVKSPVKMEEKQTDIKSLASEILQQYTMKGSVSSAAARRTQDQSASEVDWFSDEDSFYINMNTSKPRIQTNPNLISKFYSSPAQFVPVSPDFLAILKKDNSCQHSDGQLEHGGNLPSSADSCYSEQYKDQTLELYESTDNTCRENLNSYHDENFRDSLHHSKRRKTPLTSCPEEPSDNDPGQVKLHTDRGYSRDIKLQSDRDYPGDIKPQSDRDYPGDIKPHFNRDFPGNVKPQSGREDYERDESMVEVSDVLSCDSSQQSTNKMTYWEEKLLQRQTFGNIFIKNDTESSQEDLIDFNDTGVTTDVLCNKAQRLNSNMECSPLTGSKARRLNSKMDCSPLTGSKARELDTKMSDNGVKDHVTGSKWGKYADLDDDDDEFLSFDQSFTLKSQIAPSNNNKLSLRSPTKHQENPCSGDNSALRSPTKHQENPCSGEDLEPSVVHNQQSGLYSMVDNSVSSMEDVHREHTDQVKRQNIDTGWQDFNRDKLSGLTTGNDNTPHLNIDFGDESPASNSSISHVYYSNSSPASNSSVIGLRRQFTSPVLSPLAPVHTEDVEGRDIGGRSVAGLRGKFRCPLPQMSTSILKGSQRSLGAELQFPSAQEVSDNSVPLRQIEIPVRFVSLSNYKQVFIAALREHLNIILFELSVRYHRALSGIDTSSYLPSCPGKENKLSVNSNPVCKCGVPSKMVQVKKAGPNKDRFFYTCSAARNSQCKFFQWVDDKRRVATSSTDKLPMTDGASITTYIRSHHIYMYCDCLFLKKSTENIMNHFKRNVPSWVKQKMGIDVSNKKKLYLQLSKKDSSTIYSKDDLWIVSRYLDFRPSATILCKSTYYGPTSSNEVEIEPISSFCPSNWPNEERCHAILAGNVSGELSYLENLEENVTLTEVPVLHTLLSNTDSVIGNVSQKSKQIYVPETCVDDKVKELIDRHGLNEDQSRALIHVARMFTEVKRDVLLIHGVFGAGKSFLLSVVVVFLVWLFEKNDSYTPGVPYPWKLMIASTTNVAVDRILNGLLSLGYEDFVRVGSVKKISKPILPYSLHATGSDSQELKDLQMMLRSGELTTSEKQNVRQSIEKHKLGENRKKLNKVRVVGVTCASSSAPCLKGMEFPVVLLDECSQMTEPASMLPVAKFKCQKLVLVGDPMQLDPTIQGSETSTEHGLEQTLFDRLTLMGHEPVMLHTQYRCHPDISNLANLLFYGHQLQDGIVRTDRPPVMEEFPALCFYNVGHAIEKVDSNGSFYNESEAEFIMFLIQVLVCNDVASERIGVISLYKSQMYKIIDLIGTNRNCKEMKGVLVSTVDAFQGGERDIIILSCVRTKYVGFIDNQKRINVALTRARNHLLIVGNMNILNKNNLWAQIIHLCQASSSTGIQDAKEAREKLMTDKQTKVVSQSRADKQTTEVVGSQGSGDSPPMSLSEYERSLSLGGPCLDDVTAAQTIESINYNPPITSQGKHRRKRRKIDASLIEDCIICDSDDDDEELPNIFNT